MNSSPPSGRSALPLIRDPFVSADREQEASGSMEGGTVGDTEAMETLDKALPWGWPLWVATLVIALVQQAPVMRRGQAA
jgi:hypothetical protein